MQARAAILSETPTHAKRQGGPGFTAAHAAGAAVREEHAYGGGENARAQSRLIPRAPRFSSASRAAVIPVAAVQIIHHALHGDATQLRKIAIPADRLTLAKRRWRGVAEDGREFGFDLDHALHDGEAVFSTDQAVYVVAQLPEPVLTVPLGADASNAARLGWLLGNLHFQIEVTDGEVRAPDDPAVRQMLEREHISFAPAERAFHPLGGGHSHGHHH